VLIVNFKFADMNIHFDEVTVFFRYFTFHII